jgi:hypothetical protein
MATTPEKKQSEQVKEVTTINLTDEQRSVIERATGVALREISVLEHTGISARELNPGLLKAVSMVLCW